MFLAHRLAWAFVFGDFPDSGIDHINGDKVDNRIVNLRLASQSQNMQNLSGTGSGFSGLRGAYFEKLIQKWRAYINVGGSRTWLGCFDTKEEAHQAYLLAKTGLHKFSPSPRGAA